MKHDSVQYIYVPVRGRTNSWVGTVEVSVDAGVTWVPMELTPGVTPTNVTLPSGEAGQRAVLRVLSTALGPLRPRTRLRFLVRVANQPEAPIVAAGSLGIT